MGISFYGEYYDTTFVFGAVDVATLVFIVAVLLVSTTVFLACLTKKIAIPSKQTTSYLAALIGITILFQLSAVLFIYAHTGYWINMVFTYTSITAIGSHMAIQLKILESFCFGSSILTVERIKFGQCASIVMTVAVQTVITISIFVPWIRIISLVFVEIFILLATIHGQCTTQ